MPSLAIESGVAAHQRVDRRLDPRATQRRSVPVLHVGLGVAGLCDVVSGEQGALRVVEYKSAPVRRRPTTTPAQVIQLALQGLCLESMGELVSGYAVYFTNHRKMVDVCITADDRAAAAQLVVQTRTLVSSGEAPEPLVDDPRCSRCSHAGICLPDERTEALVRRVRPGLPDGEILHLTVPGSRASLRSGRVEVVRGEEDVGSVPLERVSGVVVQGNVDLSGALVRELLWRAAPIVWCSGTGRVVGHARTAKTPNGLPRVLQHVASHHGDLALAGEFVAPKIANQAVQLRRSSRTRHETAIRRLRHLAHECSAVDSVQHLLGVEGEAAGIYFGAFPTMLADGVSPFFRDSWPGRVGRGATDPLNVSLNLAYGLLLAEVIRGIHACGLDPHAGFVHSSGRNKPALALDLMEQFRPVVADSAVLNAINNGELAPHMFSTVLGSSRLRDDGRRALTSAMERRLAQQITHPVFRYRVTWRRVIEVQARMVLGLLDGSQPRYVGVRTR